MTIIMLVLIDIFNLLNIDVTLMGKSAKARNKYENNSITPVLEDREVPRLAPVFLPNSLFYPRFKHYNLPILPSTLKS